MQKITVQELVEYTRKTSEKTKSNFAHKIKTRVPKEKQETDDDGSGGDYWITSTSCIYNVIKNNSGSFYEGKIDDLLKKIEATELKKIKSMHSRNIEILSSFKDFNHEDIRPVKVLKFEKVQKVHKIYPIDNFPLYLNPNLVFTFEENGKMQIGAIWLVAKIDGFRKTELGMFCELLYRFLVKNYSDNYQISEKFCTAVDTFGAQSITYAEMLAVNMPFLIKKTIDDIKA
ncbi:hypothetical protein AQ505_13905 [Pedobacter sp. PACM 27299]|uniref:hypothetical protein n=1 Tax=Pedobacter sp. PACM 27299 TaxID=1727164 RepID=UPI0007062DE5|nr:hypothetical protein [Pedobacter sp. PACM 27299]ALL06494.1 hypothetical protein AQ505_13905 [Pedobacter sp. PACM 27299]